ncbi:peptidylprolyl isomerase [Psychromicrobium xiongbiense]|uniref:peptidylprolyl isomerase n=1 Tax=Psychromicrobium xiongbiense TaxID=3051184 RepID=UPI0025569F82|nr:peptidylprolyl isomerase [Psychromicrobium sp. YIM S02556]
MAAGKKNGQQTKRRLAQMEAKRALREQQQRRRLRDNVVAAVAAVLVLGLAITLQITVFGTNPTAAQTAAAEAGLASASASPTASMPPVPAPSVAAGKTFTGTLSLNGKPLGVSLDGTKAPQAVSVFKTLADSGYFSAKPCHRLTTGDFAVLQCGALDLNGSSAPNFAWGPVENAPTDNVYPAGTIAVARVSGNANSNGTQFFIVYKDTTIPADAAGGYSVIGKVTSGLDVVAGIAAGGVQGGGSDGKPATPVTIDSFTLS